MNTTTIALNSKISAFTIRAGFVLVAGDRATVSKRPGGTVVLTLDDGRACPVGKREFASMVARGVFAAV